MNFMHKDKIKIIDIIQKILNRDDLEENAKQEDYEEWDSMSYLSIVMEIEVEFGININEENLNKFDSVDNIFNEIVDAKK